MHGTTPNTIEGIPQFGRLEMLIPVISNIWEWPFKKRLSSLSRLRLKKGYAMLLRKTCRKFNCRWKREGLLEDRL